MALIKRVSRLFTADMHAVLDQIEEPEAVLRQAIREMEEELARQQQRGKWLVHEVEKTAAQLEKLGAHGRDLDAKLDICFANGNEDLARKLCRRKLEAAERSEQAKGTLAALASQRDELENQLASNQDQLEGMRQKAAVLVVEDTAAATAAVTGSVSGIHEDDVEIAFLREKQARSLS